MKSRRKEPLRYMFEKSLPCFLHIYEINGNSGSSKAGEALLADLSYNGCKVTSELDLHASSNEIKVIISVPLLNQLRLNGQVLWQERKWAFNVYGIHFAGHDPNLITEQLKRYSKEMRTTK